MIFSTNYKGKELVDGGMSQELEIIPNSIVLTREELVKIIGDAYHAGSSREYADHFGAVPNPLPDKQQYINSIVKG
jgi:hypothetical protein